MSVTNEIVKFIAGIELDPKDKEAFTKALKESNDICAAFRQEIADTEKEIEKLAKAGKKDSDEFKKLNSQLEITKSKLQSSSKEANKYASILGINSMSYNQLKNHASKLRKEINSLHKESDPENWEKYNNELIATEQRMKEVKAGAEQNESTFSRLKEIIGKNKGIFTVLAITGKAVWTVFQQMTEQTQAWGDGWQVTVAPELGFLAHLAFVVPSRLTVSAPEVTFHFLRDGYLTAIVVNRSIYQSVLKKYLAGEWYIFTAQHQVVVTGCKRPVIGTAKADLSSQGLFPWCTIETTLAEILSD